jgi:FkbM family methyltransferase
LSLLSAAGNEISAILSVLNTWDRVRFLWAIANNALSMVSTQSLRPAELSFMQHHESLEVRAFGREYILVQPDLGLVRELYARGIYFPEPAFLPQSGDKVIDLGANTGLFSLLCAGLGADVLAVEAQSGFKSLAHDNWAANGVLHRIKFVSALVGATTGVFASEVARSGASHWLDEPIELSMNDLLEMFPISASPGVDNAKPDIHLLKVDIEGSEFALFEEDLTWLRRVSYISMEVHPEFGDAIALQEIIEKEGFVCKLVSCWKEIGGPNKYPGYLYASRLPMHKLEKYAAK